MASHAERSQWWVHAGVLASALLVGLLAGLDPKLALLTAFGIVFVGVTFVSLTAGLCLFGVLTFVDAVLPSGGISLPKLMGVLLVLSWVATIAAGENRDRKLFEHPAFLYVLTILVTWAALSVTWAEESAPAIDAVFRYAPNAMLFLITYSAVRKPDQALWLIGALVIGTLISAGYGLATPTDPAATERLSGAVGNANETAAQLAAGTALAGALAAALRGQPLLRLAAAIVVPLSIYAVFLTLSRGGLVALGAVLVSTVLMAGRRRGAALALAAVAAVGAVTYFAVVAAPEARDRVTKLEGGTGRTDIWTVGWRMVEAEPLHGIGAGNFANTSVHYLLEPGAIRRADFIVDKPRVAHNTYLEVLAELGIVGLALFVAILLYALGCVLKAVRSFARSGDRQMEIVSRALFVALMGLLAAAFFGSREFSKQLWLLLSLGPAMLAIARAHVDSGSPGELSEGQSAPAPSR